MITARNPGSVLGATSHDGPTVIFWGFHHKVIGALDVLVSLNRLLKTAEQACSDPSVHVPTHMPVISRICYYSVTTACGPDHKPGSTEDYSSSSRSC